jgi:GR25 family glycosyltransferase involved in LPS biosynthesis
MFGTKKDTPLPVVWINLPNGIVRKNHMLQQLKGTQNHKITAINRHQVTAYAQHIPKFIMDDRMPELACLVSHLLAIQYFVRAGWPTALILEDDMQLMDSHTMQAAIARAPRRWAVLQIFTSSMHFYEKSQHTKKAWAVWDTDNTSSGAYVIKRSAAKKIMARYFVDSKVDASIFEQNPMAAVSDIVLFHRLRSYTSVKPLAYEKDYPSSFNSDHQTYSHNVRQYLVQKNLINL